MVTSVISRDRPLKPLDTVPKHLARALVTDPMGLQEVRVTELFLPRVLVTPRQVTHLDTAHRRPLDTEHRRRLDMVHSRHLDTEHRRLLDTEYHRPLDTEHRLLDTEVQ